MMKKHYSAPRAYAESFRLCEHIADGCSIKGKRVGDTNEYLFEDEDNGFFVLYRTDDGCGTDVSNAWIYLGDSLDVLISS